MLFLYHKCFFCFVLFCLSLKSSKSEMSTWEFIRKVTEVVTTSVMFKKQVFNPQGRGFESRLDTELITHTVLLYNDMNKYRLLIFFSYSCYSHVKGLTFFFCLFVFWLNKLRDGDKNSWKPEIKMFILYFNVFSHRI